MSGEVKEGTQVGRYSLLTRIARGGMADVWLARATGAEGFQKTVVIKTLLPHLATEPEFVRMFVDEALFAANLSHPNIVHIFDLGELDGAYFIAMEYVAGRTLRHIQRELRRTRRVLPPWLVLQVSSMVCEALQYAHTKSGNNGQPLNLVHRDISPENVMVSFDGETKVLDFGIAKASTAVSKTRVGVLKGKYAYMAPEQIENAMEGAAADHRVDIYALGVVMYELITGRRPFRAQNDLALLRRILDTPPDPPNAICSWVSEPLSSLILRAMARSPEDRFASAADLRAAIEAHFQITGSFPSRRHVADYVRSLFGDTAADLVPAQVAASDDHLTGRSEPPEDPWELESIVTDPKEPSVTIDLSMVLIADDDGSDHDLSGTPGGILEGPPSSRYDSALHAVPPSSRSVPAHGSSPLQLAGPASADGFDASWSIAPEAPSVAPGGEPAAALTVDASPQRKRAASEMPAAAESRPPEAVRSPPTHAWDLATRRARALQESSIPPPVAPEPPKDKPAAGHDWDAVVGRIRRTDAVGRTDRGRPELLSPEARARALFEEGLEKLRGHDSTGALECWSRALELDPTNRLYVSNVRKLKRQLEEQGR